MKHTSAHAAHGRHDHQAVNPGGHTNAAVKPRVLTLEDLQKSHQEVRTLQQQSLKIFAPIGMMLLARQGVAVVSGGRRTHAPNVIPPNRAR